MILLISIKTLKEEYLVDENMDDKYLLSIIKKSQDFIIQPLLGITKLDELLDQVDNNTVTDDNATLIKEYIQPVIAYYVLSEIVFSTAYKMKNQGVVDGDQYKFNELVSVANHYLKDSQHYEQLLRDYLFRANIILPLLTAEESKASGFNTGIFIN